MTTATRVHATSALEPPPTPSDSQWDAIRTTDAHLLVAAGAGTGKTFTVVQKVLFLLGVPVRGETHAPALRLSEIAAITFTNKAAAELKEKLRAGLRAAGRRDEAYQVDGARVGTIHAFCGDILREFALRAGLPPALSLMEEAESAMLRSECVREALLDALEPLPDEKGELTPAVAGMESLLASHAVKDVESWLGELVGHGDHLPVLQRGVSADEHPAEHALVALALRAQRLMEERLRSAASMDFDRMIAWTRDLLRDHPEVRRALQRRIRVLIVDEFQDVDPVQREIAYLLGEPGSGRADTTRLMFVGDPKQSIYRFRKADVRVWRSVQRDFERGWGRIVPLAESRRSVPGILGIVDHWLGSLLDTPIEGDTLAEFEVPYASLTPTRPDGAGAAVEILTVAAKPDGKAHVNEVVRAVEAAAVAARALELHRDGVMWRDMAVLLTSWSGLETYQAALQAAGIPTYAMRSTGFYERQEVVDILVALRAIRNPRDDRALVGFLRGPFACVSDETLLRLARSATGACWDAVDAVSLVDEGERARLQRGVGLLRHLRELRDRVPVSALVEALLDESGHLAQLVLLGADAAQKVANVRKLVRLLAADAEAGVADALLAIERARELRVIEGDARLYGERDDVLTLTSVHSAKGLEWPVVFWCDLVRTGTPNRASMIVAGDDIAIKPADDSESARFDAVAARAEQEQTAETKRLWYVAATRAKDLLVLSGVPLGVTRGSPARALFDALPSLGAAASVAYTSAKGREFQATVRTLAVNAAEGGDGAPAPTRTIVAAVEPRIDGWLPPIFAPAARPRHSATELLALERCERKHWFRYVMALPEPERPTRGSAAEIDAIRRGLIVHDVLEHWDADAVFDDLLEAAIGRWDPEAPAPEGHRGGRYRAALSDEIRGVLARSEYRAILDRAGSRRELPFVRITGQGRFTEGKIDLVAPAAAGADGYDAIDVKTSQCDAEAARRKAAQYAIQKSVYVDALEAIGGVAVRSFGFQFTGAELQVGGPIGDEERASLRERLRATLDRAHDRGAGMPAMTAHPAECRFCGYRQVGWCAGVEAPAASSAER